MLIDIPYAKEPWEQETIKINWYKRSKVFILDGYAVSSWDISVFDTDGNDVTLTMVEGVPATDDTYVYPTIKGGTDGQDYWLRLRLTLTKTGSPDQDLEGDLLIQVREEGK